MCRKWTAFEIADAAMALTAAWFGGCIIAGSFCDSPGTRSLSCVGIAVLFFAAWFGISLRSRDAGRMLTGGSLLLSACFLVFRERSDYLTIGIAGIVYFAVYNKRIFNVKTAPLSKKRAVVWAWILALLLMSFISLVTVCRYLTYCTPCFDMGVFTQMYEQMRKTGIAATTCERDKYLSHFAVHVSWVFYLFLPVYCLFPSPVTLQIIQAGAVAAGVFPLWLLGRHFGLSNRKIIGMLCVYCAMPALSGGCFYDIHENCFLTFFLLFFIYGMETGKKGIWILFMAFSLMVKEDAAIYVACLGLYYEISGIYQRDRARITAGSIVILCACMYFAFAVWFLSANGEGVMSNRYRNLVSGQAGMTEVIMTLIFNTGYALGECFDADKLEYILFMLIPFMALWRLRRPAYSYIILIPMLLLNILPDYEYQHTIDFQYNFGTIALLMLFFLLGLVRISKKTCSRVIFAGAAAALVLLCGTKLYRLNYVKKYIKNQELYSQITQLLASIPEESSVSASTFFISHLAGHDELYNIDSGILTDYVAVDLRYSASEDEESFCVENGYEIYKSIDNTIVIYKK